MKRSNPEDIRLLEVLILHNFLQTVKVVLPCGVEGILDCFGYDFDLGIIVEADCEAVESLFQLPEAVDLLTVLVEGNTGVLAHFGGVCVLVGRAHLQKNANLVTYCIGLTSVHHISPIND